MCQIEMINEMADKAPLSLKLEQLFWRTKRKLGKIHFLKSYNKKLKEKNHPRYQVLDETKNHISNSTTKNKSLKITINSESRPLQKGDIVRVCTKEEISNMLDKNDKFKGCYFMDEMWQYCGSKQKVLTRVEYFYDECNLLMRKCRNTVLLEDLRCSGDMHWKHKCDRSCYFFWREEWLEKIE